LQRRARAVVLSVAFPTRRSPDLLFQTPGFGDTTDFVDIKRHYYEVHRDLNPLGIVPKGPELSDLLQPHGREALGGSPFGNGTAPDRKSTRLNSSHVSTSYAVFCL